MTRVLLLLGILLITHNGLCQELNYAPYVNLIVQAEQNYLGTRIMADYPSHFKCHDQKRIHWPDRDSLKIFDQFIVVPSSIRDQFKRVISGDHHCRNAVLLASYADLYFPLIRKKSSAKGMHDDMSYVALALSGCNATYNSNDRSGLWAMDYLQARKVHLRVDSLIDERNGGDFTIEAGIQRFYELLNEEKDIFRAIAKYRLGGASFQQLSTSTGTSFLKELPSNQLLFFQWMAYLKNLMEQARLENQTTHYFDIFGLYGGVVVEEKTKLAAIENVMGADLKDLRGLNPVFVGSTIPGMYRKVPYLLPLELYHAFPGKKDSLARWEPPKPAAPEYTFEETVIYHKVKRGESLGTIANKHNTTVSQLKKWNNLRNDRIKQGQKLKIIKKQRKVAQDVFSEPEVQAPANKERVPVEVPASDSTKKEVRKGEIVSPNTSEKTRENQSKKENKSEKKTVTYVVKSGDSLWKIASKYKGVSADDIKKWNKCGDDIRPGQKLIIHPKK